LFDCMNASIFVFIQVPVYDPNLMVLSEIRSGKRELPPVTNTKA
jgi:hypothetical protein